MGIIFTWYSSEYSGNIVKWKGPQEWQPSAVTEIKNAIMIIEEEKIEGCLRDLFENLREVAEADSEINPYVKERLQFKKEKLIVDGIYHSMRKFDDIESFTLSEDGLENYIKILRDEVRKHYVEEKKIEDNLEDDNPILKFINDTVKNIVIKK